MGYSTLFWGSLSITPQITDEHRQEFTRCLNEDTTDVFAEWSEPAKKLRLYLWGGDRKGGYDLPHITVSEDGWLEFDSEAHDCDTFAAVLQNAVVPYFQALGYGLEGTVSWAGSDASGDDRGTVYVSGGDVEQVTDTIDNPGPAWAYQDTRPELTELCHEASRVLGEFLQGSHDDDHGGSNHATDCHLCAMLARLALTGVARDVRQDKTAAA